MMPNLVVGFDPDAFTTDGRPVFGRRVAGEGFLNAFLRALPSEAEPICFSRSDDDLAAFRKMVQAARGEAGGRLIRFDAASRLQETGTLFWPSPYLCNEAWRRVRISPTGWSIIGITHSLASREILQELATFGLAPVRNFDALVCTSRAALAVVDDVLSAQEDYLRDRLGATRLERPQLPIIPLGVDTSAFAPSAERRERARATIGLKPDQVCIVSVGRINPRTKAHPVPLFVALKRLAAVHPNVTLLVAGWFPDAQTAQAFFAAAGRLCPEVKIYLMQKPGEDEKRLALWAADIFISLADNLQETFGLAPVEAMAAGLPCVVADWDGYRDTVRHGVDGFRVPTYLRAVGSEQPADEAYLNGLLGYEDHVARLALQTVIDIGATVSALDALVSSTTLRSSMGAAARKRAAAHYDWSHVISAYTDLTRELARRRASEARLAPTIHPAHRNPLSIFRFHATSALDDAVLVQACDIHGIDAVDNLCIGDDRSDHLKIIIGCGLEFVSKGERTMSEIVAHALPERQDDVVDAVFMACKFGMLRVVQSE